MKVKSQGGAFIFHISFITPVKRQSVKDGLLAPEFEALGRSLSHITPTQLNIFIFLQGMKWELRFVNLHLHLKLLRKAIFSQLKIIITKKPLPRKMRGIEYINQMPNSMHDTNHITKKAAKEKKLAKYDAEEQSKKSQIEGIRDNRAEERDRERQAKVWNISETDSNDDSSAPVKEILTETEINQIEEQYVPAPDYTDLLSEMLNDEQNQQKNKH